MPVSPELPVVEASIIRTSSAKASSTKASVSALHVIVPGLCGPLADLQSVRDNPILKQWIHTLEKSSAALSFDNVNDVLASVFKLKAQADFPSAALTLLANDSYDASKYYMHADPVHLQADMDRAILTSSHDLTIGSKETKRLLETLNQHFAQDDLRFISLQHDQWFVVAKTKINMQTTPLVEAVARNINFILPEGEHAMRWKQLLTEAQMLLFAHEVNSTRENNALMSINSLWFYGSGELPEILGEDHIHGVCSNHGVLKGLAKLLKCNYLSLPASVNEYSKHLLAEADNQGKNTINVLHLDDIEHLVNYTDTSLWLEKLTELLEQWIYPLLQLAHKNNIQLVLHPCNKKQYHFAKYDFLKFWHKAKLDQHISQY